MAKPDPIDTLGAQLPTFDDAAEEGDTLSLREVSAEDPANGCPRRITEPNGETLEIEPGQWLFQGFVDRSTGLPPDCPVIPLGREGSTYHVLNAMGGHDTLDAKSSGKGPIGSLFAGRSRYVEWMCPRLGAIDKKTGKPKVNGWDADDVRQLLMDACAYKGVFRLEDQIRGRGAWRDDDGSLIYHAGDKIWLGGRWCDPGQHGRHIYPARGRLGRPAKKLEPEGPGSPGDALYQLLETWNWGRKDLDPRLVLGWIMTARIGGALDERPGMFMTAEEGSGKTALIRLAEVVMCGGLLSVANTTQAGIYQHLGQDSIGVIVDENEAKEDTRGTDRIFELARAAYSGGRLSRGGKDGVGLEFVLRSSFMYSAVVKPPMESADESRMAVVTMRPLVTPKSDKKLFDAIAVQTWGAQLLRRWFEWWPRWDKLLTVIRDALASAGHTPRGVDTFAPLVAGYHVAMRDDMPSDHELAEWMGMLQADKLEETANREKTWRRCLKHLLDVQPDVLRTRALKSVGAALLSFAASDNRGLLTDVDDALALCGLSLSWSKDSLGELWSDARLFVPVNHPSVHALFAGTTFGGRLGAPGPWCNVLRQMPPHLWVNGKCEKGLDRKAAGVFIRIKDALEA